MSMKSWPDRPHLHRENRDRQAAQHQLSHRPERFGGLLKRHEVLQLVEVGVIHHRVDAVAAVHAPAGGVAVRLVPVEVSSQPGA